jgi:hypothetical protein
VTDLSDLLDTIDRVRLFEEWRDTGVPAARALEEAVCTGAALGPLVDRVRETCAQHSHVPLLAPLASALLLDALRRDDATTLDDLTGRKLYLHGFRRAVLRAAGSGLPPARLLMARYWHDGLNARSVAHELVEKQPEQLVPLVEAFAADPVLNDEMPRLLQALASWRDTDVGPALPLLASFLTADGPREPRQIAVGVVADAAGSGAEVGALLPKLEELLSQRDPAVLEAAARGLTEADPAAGAVLAGRPEVHVRRGVLTAKAAGVDLLARGLLDAHPDNRLAAFRGLERREWPVASTGTLVVLASSGPEGEAARYLRHVLDREDVPMAAVLDAMPPGKTRDALAAGMPWCRICRRLKRRASHDGPSRFDAAVTDLVPPPSWDAKGKPGKSPAGGVSRTELGTTRCPVCGWRYRLRRDQNHRGIYEEFQYEMARLPPSSSAYPAREREALVARLQRDLDHLEPNARTEAGWGLATLALERQDWPDLRTLLAHPEVEVRKSAVNAVPYREAPPVPLLGDFQRLLQDDDERVREGAARRLAACGVGALMQSEDAAVLSSAVDRLAMNSSEMPEHVGAVTALLNHADVWLAHCAGRALERAVRDGVEVPTESLVQIASDEGASAKARGRAMRVLSVALRQRGFDAPAHRGAAALLPLLPALLDAALLDDPVGRGGPGALELGTVLARHHDVADLLPPVARWVEANRSLSGVHGFFRVALLGPTDRDAVLSHAAKMLFSDWETNAAATLLRLARSADITGAMPVVYAGLSSDTPIVRAQCARMCVHQALRHDDSVALAALLAHRSADLRAAAVSELVELKVPPPASSVPALVALLSDPAGWVVGNAARCLARCADRSIVRAAFEALPDGEAKTHGLAVLSETEPEETNG